MLSVPVTSLNRYCANLKISRLHLFLQLIFAPGLLRGGGGAGSERSGKKKKKKKIFARILLQCKNKNIQMKTFTFCPLLSCSPVAVSAWPSCLRVAAVMIMSEWRALRGLYVQPGSSGTRLRGEAV